jgi:integrase
MTKQSDDSVRPPAEKRTVAKRSHGDGGIDERGAGIYRLRYRINGRRFSKTFKGTLTEARKELRALIRSGDAGEHVDPSKITVGQWIDQWIAAGAPGRRKEKVGERTLERYADLVNVHVKPVLGNRRLQQLRPQEIDKLYSDMAEAATIAPRTQHHVHVVLGACLGTAARKGLLVANPMLRVEQVPSVKSRPVSDPDADTEGDDIGEGLTEAELAALISGFKTSSIYPIVVLAAATGARRNEILALRWTDLDTEKKTLRIERAWEPTKKFGLRLKSPKTERGRRTIDLDDATVLLLTGLRETHQRLSAGIPDGADVDLSLIRLPAAALIFPNPPEPGADLSFTVPRIPRSVSQAFARRADKIGFGRIRLHDLRGVHSTALLDALIPVHTVAQRIGDDPATLLRNYTKRKRSKAADKSLSDAIAGFATGFLGS